MSCLHKMLGDIVRYEVGELNHDDKVRLFQQLIDTGNVWKLRRSYVEEAVRLIARGEVNVSVR